MLGNDSLAAEAWQGVVSVRDDAALAGELTDRLRTGPAEKPVGVTDLLSLRPAYYRAVVPAVPIPPSRQARLDQGRSVHHQIGLRLSREGTLEARVRRDGLVGRIDILAEIPIEVKTAASLVDAEGLLASRPEHLEQLAMYCALAARPSGRLLTVLVSSTSVTDLQVVDVAFRSTDRILLEMRRRAGQLRQARAESRVADLPRCPWFGRGCEFEESGVCDCTGREPGVPFSLTQEIRSLGARTDVGERLRPLLAGPIAPRSEGQVGRFRELLYPRRTFYERTAPVPSPEAEGPPPRGVPDLYVRLSEALESGPAGEVARLPTLSEEPEEEVVGFRGRPVLVRTSRARSAYRSAELVSRAPQYALELGLRCAAAGSDSGLVVIGHEHPSPDRPIQVFEVRFTSLTPFSRFFRERRRSIARAVRDRTPDSLPACPRWMAAQCPYRAACGCEGPEARVSR